MRGLSVVLRSLGVAEGTFDLPLGHGELVESTIVHKFTWETKVEGRVGQIQLKHVTGRFGAAMCTSQGTRGRRQHVTGRFRQKVRFVTEHF